MKDKRTVQFKQWKCYLKYGVYNNGRMAIELFDAFDHEPIAKATVNVPNIQLAQKEIIIKAYSENEGMLDALEKAGVIKKTGRAVPLGAFGVFGDIVEYIPFEVNKVTIAVIDQSINGLFLYEVDEGMDSEQIEDYLHSEGRKISNCCWGQIDGTVEDLRDE